MAQSLLCCCLLATATNWSLAVETSAFTAATVEEDFSDWPVTAEPVAADCQLASFCLGFAWPGTLDIPVGVAFCRFASWSQPHCPGQCRECWTGLACTSCQFEAAAMSLACCSVIHLAPWLLQYWSLISNFFFLLSHGIEAFRIDAKVGLVSCLVVLC